MWSRPFVVTGLAGSSFFLIGGAAMAVIAIVFASVPGIVVGIVRSLGRSAV